MSLAKQWIILILAYIAVAVALSVFANIAYLVTFLVISGWTVLGHTATLDDDMPGGWNNPENSADIWKKSKIELLVKIIIFTSLLALAIIFPGIGNLGSN
jgi:hypothetical protein